MRIGNVGRTDNLASEGSTGDAHAGLAVVVIPS